MTILIALWALLGLLVAIPLNHLADRLPQHKRLRAAPACEHCGQAYQRRQWLALLARASGRGRCLGCGQGLPLRRSLLEVGLVILYAALVWRYGLSWRLPVATFHASVLALIVVTDLEHRLVPNAVVLPAMVVTVALSVPACPRCVPNVLLAGGIGFLLFLVLALIYPGGMGFGDVKLAGYIGLIAGYPRVMVCLVVAILSGGVGAAALLLSGKGTRRTYIPYAPFLALGGGLALFLL